MLEIYAGATAKKVLQKSGLSEHLFSSFLGASGGPKWFTLFGLDKYLFGEFFKNRTNVLNMIGSSAGAFRAACFAQNDPVSAITRLAKYYSETVYSEKVTANEITHKARMLLDEVFGETGASDIINNPVFKAHFIVAKTNGLVASENKVLQMAGLVKSYLLNRVDRTFISNQYERYIYQSPTSQLKIEDEYSFATHHIDLTEKNIREALLASGSIPIVMEGVRNIPDSPKGMYRDGGIIDYHFDIKLQNDSGLILYPHFNANPKAGWFDKSLKRGVSPNNYDRVVMIVPTSNFVSSLPFGKIPDRDDFKVMQANDRIKYWRTVLSETDRLAEYFDECLIHNKQLTIKSFQ